MSSPPSNFGEPVPGMHGMPGGPNAFGPALPPVPARPGFELFSVGQVTAAAFFGSPIAGGILMALNKRRLGTSGDATKRLLVGLGITVLLFVVGAFLPGHSGNFVPIAGVFAIRAIAERDKAEFAAHVAAGGKKAGLGSVVAIAGASFVAVLGVVFLAMMPSLHLGPFAYPHVDFGHDQEVLYTEGATPAEAKQLGEFLKQDRFFDDTAAKEVHLARKGPVYVVGINVKQGIADDPHFVHLFSRMAGRISLKGFPGNPVTIQLLDDDTLKKTIETPALFRIEYGNEQTLTYDAAVGEAGAKKVGAYLLELGFFGPKQGGKDVEIRQEGDITIVSFIVGDGVWNDPEISKGFETIREHIVEKAFPGKKVRLDLCNTSAEPQKSLGP